MSALCLLSSYVHTTAAIVDSRMVFAQKWLKRKQLKRGGLFAAPSDLLLTGTKDESTVMVMRGVAAQLAFCTLPPHSYMALGLSAL